MIEIKTDAERADALLRLDEIWPLALKGDEDARDELEALHAALDRYDAMHPPAAIEAEA